MNESLYRAHAELEQLGRLHRRAHLPLAEPIDMGVHGPIQEHYRLSPDRPLPLPVDYIVAATGG